jgi:hypothetical protein
MLGNFHNTNQDERNSIPAFITKVQFHLSTLTVVMIMDGSENKLSDPRLCLLKNYFSEDEVNSNIAKHSLE